MIQETKNETATNGKSKISLIKTKTKEHTHTQKCTHTRNPKREKKAKYKRVTWCIKETKNEIN